ncbi:coiled-coil domain-containing protein 138-like isoform X2 [Neoarius graeffei]|uniref:coiled-coil domain-containing protein 138-like isoform X2 n=1 Tax=Neoarius graeffei TaxID=443677 RepID=UPI00298BD4F9|nr:coiled-coil domain-containing protein 138-like isoform X2 [Neoarius graeffei]
MSTELSGSDLDLKVEILKKKYLERRNRVSATEEARVSEKSGSVQKPAECCAATGREEVKTSCREMRNYSRALEELFHAVSDRSEWLFRDECVLSSEDELSDQTDALGHTNILCTETDVTLPSNIVCTSSSFETEPVVFSRAEGLRSSAPIEQVYHEMIQIYKKLQQHQQEMESLRAALREKTKENKRIKSSLDSIKELNNTMKKQLNEVCEQNTKLERQSRKVQARLENLQRKYEYSVKHRGWENMLKSRDLKPFNQDKPPPPHKACKSTSSSTAVRLLSYMMDWIVDGPPLSSEDVKTEREFDPYGVPHPSLHERCAKILPILLEQFEQAEAFLHSPLLRFIYCTLTQLEHSTQHLPLTSTLRRLGEEVNRKSPPLFRSSCPHTRFLSSIIVLKTLSQADILAQALDVLHGIVGEDEGRGLFLKYKALMAILALLRTGSPGLLAPSLDILLQMSAESRHLPGFLEVCSTDQFFRCAAVLLRNPRLDLAVAEKLSILLQKLSCIRKNRRLFEASSLHLLLQETRRSANPSRAFLNINLSSILFNLGVASRS